jgi:phage protein D
VNAGRPDQAEFSTRIGKNHIASIDVDLSEKKLSVARIQLVDLTPAIVNNNIMQEDVEITIVYGIVGSWNRSHRMVIKETDTSYGGTISMNLTAMDFRTRAVQQKTDRSWNNRTASEIVTDICKVLNWKTDGVVPTTDKISHVSGGSRSYSEIVAELAWRENFRFIMRDDICVFEPAFDLSKSTTRVHTYWINNSSTVKFDVKNKTHVNAPHAHSSRATTQDPKTGEVKTENASNTPSTGGPGARRTVAITYQRGGGYTAQVQVRQPETPTQVPNSGATDLHPEGSHHRANAKQTQAAWKFSSASLETLNDPIDLGDVIEILGVAEKHSGLYKASQVKITIQGSDLKVGVTLNRDTGKHKKNRNKSGDANASSTTNTTGASASKPPTPRVRVTYRRGGGYNVTRS